MATLNSYNYLQSETKNKNKTYKNWWLVKIDKYNNGLIRMNNIHLPKTFVGKRVRFKLEIIEDDINE